MTAAPKKHPCAGTSAGPCAGFFTLVPDVPGISRLAQARTRANHPPTGHRNSALMHLYTRHIRHIRHIVVFKRKNGKEGGTVAGTNHSNPAQPQNLAQTTPKQATRTIRCTPDNAKEIQQLVKADPQLLSLVQSLQAQGLFPGLRALSFTLTGTPEHCAKGLQAVAESAQADPGAQPQGNTPC